MLEFSIKKRLMSAKMISAHQFCVAKANLGGRTLIAV
jgi:hypothetical protein